MRIGVNCFLLQANIGGIKQYFVTLFDWLLENDRKNDYVFFYFEHNLVELEKLRSPRWRYLSKLLSVQDQIADHLAEVDVYFCPFSALWPRPAAIPSVVTLVDIQEVFYPQFFSYEDLYSRAWHYPSSTRAADRVVTISQFSKASIVKHHGLHESKVIVAHLAADSSYFDAVTSAMPPDVPIPFDRFLFFPANRWLHKNHDTLLRALKLLKERGERTNLVVTGFDMPGGYPLQDKAAEYGISECVHAAGYVTVAQMAHLYQSAEMTVFPSLFEGFGMPPVEAMAAGCPVVVARTTCLPEICGEAAEYFEPMDAAALAEAICKVRGNRLLRADLIGRGLARAKHFSAESMARAHLRAFQEAIDSYSSLRYRWHKAIYQPYHKWRVDKINHFGFSQANALSRSWAKKALAQGRDSSLDLFAWPRRKIRLRVYSKEIRIIEESGLFDANFYRAQVRIPTATSPVQHYLLAGALAGFDPNPLFSSSWYLRKNSDVAAAGVNPLIHFLLFGSQENRSPHPLFDLWWYLEQNPDVRASGVNPLAHYMNHGAAEARNPHPLFDASFYLTTVPDYNQARLNPLTHYLAQPPLCAGDPHPLFPGKWYLQQNPDVAAAGINPLMHYVAHDHPGTAE